MKNSFLSVWALVAAAMLALGGCASNGQQKSAGQVIDDTVITTKVKSAFVGDQKVSALNISVHTSNGVVQLSGVAKDQQESWKAADIARHVEGVRGVRNEIVVR